MSREWLTKEKTCKKMEEGREAAQECEMNLHSIPWGLSKTGLTDVGDVLTLSRMLGPNWLSCSIMNDLMDLLQAKLGEETEFRFKHTWLTPLLQDAFKEDGSAYDREVQFTWIHETAEDMMKMGKTVVTYTNVNDNHWVFLGINALTQTIYFGDPFEKVIPKEVEDVYQRWGEEMGIGKCTVKEISVGKQADGVNCRMYVHTGAANFVLPGMYNLATSSMVNIAQMKWFSKLAGRITRMVCIILLDTSLIDEVASSRWMNLMNVRTSQIQSLKPVVWHIQVSSSDPKIASTH